MPTNLKKQIRGRMLATGETYQQAEAALRARCTRVTVRGLRLTIVEGMPLVTVHEAA